MECRNFRERLSEFLDRQLAGPEQAGAEAHVSACPGCRSEFEELKGVSQMVSGVGRKPLPPGFMQRLERRRQAEGQPAAAERSYFLLPPGLPRFAAFALSSLVVIFLVMNQTKTMMQPAQSMISGAAGTYEASNFKGVARGPGAGAGGGLDSLKRAGKEETAGESVNMQTLNMLKKAAAGQPSDFNSAGASAASSLDQAASRDLAKAEASSFTSTGKKLARARGEPVAESRGGIAAMNAPAASAAAAAPQAHQYTNEELAASIESEKAKMRIIPPSSGQNGLQLAMLRAQGRGPSSNSQRELLEGAPEATPLSGDTPAILGTGGGAAVRGSALDAKTPLDEAPGVLIRSEAERQDLWHKYQMTADPPKVDYATQMLAVVFATSPSTAIQISRVSPNEDRISIYFHEVPLPQNAAAGSSPTYQFRVIPKTDKPVVFEKLP